MGVAEPGGVFQSIAERAVESDMGGPYHAERNEYGRGQQLAGRCQEQRPNERMRGVIDDGADAWPAEIAGKTQIGSKKQNRKQPPG